VEGSTPGVEDPLGLRRGDVVRVRPAVDIARTLDERGEIAGLPFMPEMLPMCGSTFQVSARADTTCDTITMSGTTREMDDAVHLVGARCDGSAHGGCQAACLLYFKESWLERVEPSAGERTDSQDQESLEPDPPAELVDLLQSRAVVDAESYRCQATQLIEATHPLPSVKHYLRDVRTGNVSPRRLPRSLFWAFSDRYQRVSRRLPERLRLNGGKPMPKISGTASTPQVVNLDLEPGDIVEVKSVTEIEATLKVGDQRHKGLWYDREMMRYSGTRRTVLAKVERLLDEKTGKMMYPKTTCLILEGAVCEGDYHGLCQRQIYGYYRENWVRRVGPAPESNAGSEATPTDAEA
jgi:hypothetical protein